MPAPLGIAVSWLLREFGISKSPSGYALAINIFKKMKVTVKKIKVISNKL